jgi:hypothetical protein
MLTVALTFFAVPISAQEPLTAEVFGLETAQGELLFLTPEGSSASSLSIAYVCGAFADRRGRTRWPAEYAAGIDVLLERIGAVAERYSWIYTSNNQGPTPIMVGFSPCLNSMELTSSDAGAFIFESDFAQLVLANPGFGEGFDVYVLSGSELAPQ